MKAITLVVAACAMAAAAVVHGQQGGGSDLSTNVNLGGGSSWRGTVPTGPVPRLPDGTVDLTGVWQGGGPGGSNGGLERGLATGETIPILPAAKAQMAARGPLDNTEALCLPAGVPRVPSAYPWRMVQTPSHKAATHIFMLFEANIHSFRQIFMDGRKHPAELDPTWFGHSIGSFDKDTLVIDSVGFNEKQWLAGSYPTTGQLHLVERISRPSLKSLVYEATIDDPGAYTKPWSVRWTINEKSASSWIDGGEIFEYICQDDGANLER